MGKTSGKAPQDSQQEQIASYFERARRELMFSLDRPVSGLDDMYSEDEDEWYINRYSLKEKDKKRVVRWSAQIDYDFVKADLREKQQQQIKKGERKDTGQRGLQRPWSEPFSDLRISALGASLRNRMRYNIYFKQVMRQNFRLNLPRLR